MYERTQWGDDDDEAGLSETKQLEGERLAAARRREEEDVESKEQPRDGLGLERLQQRVAEARALRRRERDRARDARDARHGGERDPTRRRRGRA